MENKEPTRKVKPIIKVTTEEVSDRKIFLEDQVFTSCKYVGCEFVYTDKTMALFGPNNTVTGGRMIFAEHSDNFVAACFASYILARGYDLPPDIIEFVDGITADLMAAK